MSRTVQVRVTDPEYVYGWLRKLFEDLRLLQKNKFKIRLVKPENESSYIEITRNT